MTGPLTSRMSTQRAQRHHLALAVANLQLVDVFDSRLRKRAVGRTLTCQERPNWLKLLTYSEPSRSAAFEDVVERDAHRLGPWCGRCRCTSCGVFGAKQREQADQAGRLGRLCRSARRSASAASASPSVPRSSTISLKPPAVPKPSTGGAEDADHPPRASSRCTVVAAAAARSRRPCSSARAARRTDRE